MTEPKKAMGLTCLVHIHKHWVPIEVHHVWPLGFGGPNKPENKVPLCSNAHSSVHDLLDKMLKARKLGESVPWAVRRHYGAAVRDVAWRGYSAIIKAGVDA